MSSLKDTINPEVLSVPASSLQPTLEFRKNYPVTVDQFVEMYDSAGWPRPITDRSRIQAILDSSTMLISVWDQERLVGLARVVTDWVFICYLSHVAVRKEYQKGGLGKQLIMLAKDLVGPQPDFVLKSSPASMGFYTNIGMRKIENGFMFDGQFPQYGAGR
ncbi:hypothetical protein RvY_11619 [Ramazzottius varieornatus]|uniref:N-acetyltransferase domain-containing protein n=1 Tax=Ramazzottius varieornatus TaxID=947166 RepID=A0A1D1VGP7_RAMVA|nr:hypothetical protein RvY_11619 [Ramazzottius varieornatus]